MNELYLVLAAVGLGVVIAVFFWIDYRRTPCPYGGDTLGENNWHFGYDTPEDDS